MLAGLLLLLLFMEKRGLPGHPGGLVPMPDLDAAINRAAEALLLSLGPHREILCPDTSRARLRLEERLGSLPVTEHREPPQVESHARAPTLDDAASWVWKLRTKVHHWVALIPPQLRNATLPLREV